MDDGEDDDADEEPEEVVAADDEDDGDDTSDDGEDDDADTKRATLAALERDVTKLRREASARKAGYASRADQRAAEDRIWRSMRLDPAAVRATTAKRASSRAALGSPPYAQSREADRNVILDAAKHGAELSREHVKMLRKMGHDDAGIAAIAAKLAKDGRN